ncbi:hypothetical RNA binding protein [Thalassiosira pseudonana CCMP1335]|jgi:hypothetical protein|uniref:Hypothetical RNA binding protein n=1 Tax=Thalassiosira pseudonana TaxID=35128 RepID=B5YNI2_THAPS|nr:hypothetical RNA binding protein [Thalassiosira pseudonana CCMP1335]ACI64994.1 hypothetical RNA binding protein [Thalassiosira pseudonana CCMP1335]
MPVPPKHRYTNPPNTVDGGRAASPLNTQPVPTTPESLALSCLRQTAISHPAQQCQITIYVPSYSVGAVIGRGGKTILNVQREAMKRSVGHTGPVKISVLGGYNNPSGTSGGGDKKGGPSSYKNDGTASTYSTWNYNEYYNQQQTQHSDITDPESDEDDEWTPVIIRGDPVGCLSAARQVIPIIDRAHDPDIVFEVPIHRTKHNLLVGKKGVVLAAMSATFQLRIMIPPNDLISKVESTGGTNYWKQRQVQTEAGNIDASTLLFAETMGSSETHPIINAHDAAALSEVAMSTLPPNVIQLEGDIDNIEKCLIKMLSIVSGERFVPPGVIVSIDEEKKDTTAKKAKGHTKDKDLGNTVNAEAIVVSKAGTPASKISLGKLRSVQRKTNTVIRRKRKKVRVDGGDNANEQELDAAENAEPSYEADNIDEEKEGGDDTAVSTKTAQQYVITGSVEGVKAAVAAFEKALGLATGSSVVRLIDTEDSTNELIPADGEAATDKDGTDAKAKTQRRRGTRKRGKAKSQKTDEGGGPREDASYV